MKSFSREVGNISNPPLQRYIGFESRQRAQAAGLRGRFLPDMCIDRQRIQCLLPKVIVGSQEPELQEPGMVGKEVNFFILKNIESL